MMGNDDANELGGLGSPMEPPNFETGSLGDSGGGDFSIDLPTDDDPNERDYNLSDDAQVALTTPELEKNIRSTDFAETTGDELAIGEIVVFEIIATIPEGQRRSSFPTHCLLRRARSRSFPPSSRISAMTWKQHLL